MRSRRLKGVVAAAVLALAASACGTRVDDTTSATSLPTAGTGGLAGDASGGGTGGAVGVTGATGDAATATGTGDAGAGAGTGTGGSGPVASGAAATGGAGGATSTGGGATSASGGGTTSAAGQGGTIVLGAVGTTSGIVGSQGASNWASLRVWAQAVNASGGIGGRQVKLIIVDDGGDPGRNGAAVRQLIDEHRVQAFVGSYAPISFSGGLGAIEQAGLPAIGGDSAEAGWFRSANAFPFNGQALPQGKALARFGCERLKQRKLAIYYVQEIAFGGIIADVTADQFAKCGKEVVAKTGVSLAQPDFTSEVLQAQSRGAEIVAVYSDISGCRRFWNAARRQRFTPVFLGAVSCYNPGAANDKDMVEGKLFVGVSTELPTADTPGMKAMRAAMQRFVPGTVNFIDGQMPLGWASGKIYEAAVAAAGGSTDPKRIIAALQAMRDVTLDGLIPPLTWGPGRHSEKPCAKVVRNDGDTWSSQTPDFLC